MQIIKGISLSNIIFVICTWGYLILNILIAWLPSLSNLLLIFRDSWVFLFILLLIRACSRTSIFLYMSLLLLGLIPLIMRHDLPAIMTAFYGVRDITLYFLIAESLKYESFFNGKQNNAIQFTRVVLLICLIEVLLQLVGLSMSDIVFNTGNYFSNKGVNSNLNSGLLGDRLTVPFYSSALVCTLLSIVYFFFRQERFSVLEKSLAFIVCVFTMSKVLVFTFAFRFLGKYWKTLMIGGLLFVVPFMSWLSYYRQYIDDPLITYHLASTFHHLRAFSLVIESGVFDLLPDIVGTHSVAGKNYLELDFYTIESSFLTRILDYGIYSILFIYYILYSYFTLSDSNKKKYFVYFIILMLLTATSNHPFIYITLICIQFSSIKERGSND